VAGGDNSLISLKKGDLDLKSGAASVKLSQGNLTTNATETRLNGRVTLGQPAATDIATPEHVVEILEFIAGGDDLTDLKTRIAALRASLNL
jgi:hypothetical protein